MAKPRSRSSIPASERPSGGKARGGTAEERTIRQLLLAIGEELPGDVEGQILDFGTRAVAPLCAILGDEALLDDEGPGEGMAPCHAAWLLGRLGATDGAAARLAIGPLLDAVVDDSASGLLRGNAATQALAELGPGVVEPALKKLRAAGLDARLSLCEMLGRLGVRDDRVRAALCALLDEDPEAAAACLTDYGDPAALPALAAALDRRPVVADDIGFANEAVVELYEAIEALGGTPTASQQEKYAQATGRPIPGAAKGSKKSAPKAAKAKKP